MDYPNISTKRLCYFYGKVFDIEARVFGKDEKLFNRCHSFNRRLWEIILARKENE